MKYKAKQVLLFLPVIILVSAFSIFAQRDDLTRGKWKLVEANGKAVTNSAAFIDFDRAGNRFTGNTGCNTMNGTADIRGRQIDLTRIVTTKRMCKLMAGNVAEGEFLKALGDTVRFGTNGDTLRMFDRRGRRILRFTRMADEPAGGAAKLGGKKWSLESIKERRTFAPITGAFIRFDESKGSIGGDTSCNVFGGEYSTSGRDSIAFTDMISTMRACIEDGKMNVEREMMAGLRAANRYEVRDGRLFLYRGNRLELTFRQERN